MIRLKHAGLGAALLLACLLGYSFSSSPRVHAASCSGAIAFNRAPGCGWFHNQYAGSGGPMFADGMGTTSTTDELVSYIQGKCDDGGSDETAAAVIVMDSLGYSAPTTGGCSNSSMFNQWAADVKGYGSYGCTSGTCTGPSGRVNFYDSQEYFCGEVDTMLTDINGTYDVAPFNISGSTDPACGTTANDVIIFYNTNNDPIFYIRRDCGNILRAIGHLVAPPPPVIATACTYSVTNYAIPDPDQGYAINAIITYNLSGSASSAAKNGKLSIGVVKVPNGRTDSNVGMNVSGNQVKGSLTEPPPGGQGDDYDNDIQISLNDTKDGPRASINCKGNLEVVNASCGGLSQSPSQIDPAQSFSITTTLTYNPPLGVPPNQANTAYRAFHANVNGGGDDLYNMTVTGPNGVMTPTSRTASYGATGSYSYETVTESFQPTGVPGAINTTYSSSGTMAPTNQSTTIPGGACNAPQVIVASLPYFEVEGGDLEAGAGMYQNGATCSPSADTRAGIASWNQEAPSYDGAGTQYAAMALGVLQDFVTGQGSTASPSGLSFANNTDVAADTFGGAFGALPCMPDYFSPPSDPTQVGGDYTVDINDIAPASSCAQRSRR